ncbi:MAG: hypothetical protein SFY69_10390 [Planctomycetota bacterium]|nr:hypothetical protein [Planctomycetota bacterium]
MSTPPFEPGLIDEMRPIPSWPKVIGIISICWGALGLVCTGCGGLWYALGPQWLAQQPGMGELPPSMKPTGAMWLVLAAGLGLAGLLIGAGVTCTMRRPVARPLHLVYAVLALLVGVVSTYVQWQTMVAMNQWVAENPDSQFAKQHNAAGQMAGLVAGLVIGNAWPLFALVWFGAVKRTRESFGPPPEPTLV